MNKIIVLTGPTGIGKTKYSLEIAKKFNGEIINADSRQVYQGLDIGTAKIKEQEQKGIPHHLIDIKEIDEEYNAYDYQQDCRLKIKEILNRKKTPILIGGTGLYLKAALYDYDFKVSTRNKESSLKTNPKLLYDVIFIGLTIERNILYERINKRVDEMVKEGLFLEVKSFYEKGIREKPLSKGIGYQELYEYFDKKITQEEAIKKIKQNTRKYAKRQYTWFRNKMNLTWFDISDYDKSLELIIKYIKKQLD